MLITQEATMQSGFADVNGAKIYYETDGTGFPLVLVHAGIANNEMWDDQFREFAKGYQVIRYDMRGYGKTEPVDGEYSRYEDLYGILKFLGVEKAILIGCSMGGEASMNVTLEHPEMVKALIMVCSGPDGYELDEEPPPQWDEMVKAWKAGDLDQTAELEAQIWMDGIGQPRDRVPAAVRNKMMAMNRIALEHEKKGLGKEKPPLDPPAAQRLSEIHVPTLIIVGDYDTPFSQAAGDYMVEHITGAQKVTMPTAHLPSMERPDELNQHVQKFLSGIG
jgi:pimeloyl-ACP methyl ester carboxylesterase